MNAITPQMAKVLRIIADYQREHGCTPSYRKLADELGLKSPSGALRLVDDLICRGYVRKISARGKSGRYKANSLVLVFGADSEPDWQGIATLLMDENRRMRATLEAKGLPVPAKGVNYG
jgi:SOS-response transcriptional repressor LexA